MSHYGTPKSSGSVSESSGYFFGGDSSSSSSSSSSGVCSSSSAGSSSSYTCCSEPIEIAGVFYQLDYFDGHGTQGIITEFHEINVGYADVSTAGGPWTLVELPIGDIGGQGEISFGVSCASSVQLAFYVSDTSTWMYHDGSINVYLNGVLVASNSFSSAGDPPYSWSPSITLAGACGDVISVVAVFSRNDASDTTDGVFTLTVTPTVIP